MLVGDFLKWSFSSKSQEKATGIFVSEIPSQIASVDKIFAHLLSIVKSPQAIEKSFAMYLKAREDKPDKKEQGFISAYTSFEQFITRADIPLVSSKYDETKLREEVSKNINVLNLSPYFRAVFQSESEQAVILIELDIRLLVDLLGRSLGTVRIQGIIDQITSGTILQSVFKIAQDGSLTVKRQSVQANSNLTSVVEVGHKFNEAIFQYASDSLGAESASKIFKQNLELIKTIYPLDLISLYLDILPKEPFASERLSLLTREDLERAVSQRTQQAQQAREMLEDKLSKIEEQNKALDDNKLAMLNLLEDARELEGKLKEEKENVDKKVEERTKQFYEEKARLQASMNSLHIGFIMTDMHNTVLLMNTAAKNILYSKERVETEVLSAQLPSSVNVNVPIGSVQKYFVGIIDLATYIAQCIREKKQIDIKELSYGNRLLQISFVPIVSIQDMTNIQGEIIGAIIVLQDITEQKKLERSNIEQTKELSEEQARLQASINSLTRGFIMVDSNHTILGINKAAKETLHLVNDNPTIEQIQKQLQDKLDLVSEMVKCLGTHAAIDLKEVIFGNQYLRIFMTPIVLESNKAIGVVILVEDITEVKAIQRSKDEFFSIASHELRTPLTAIRGNTSLIEQYYMDKLPDKELKDMILDIHESSIRLISIVNDFLDTSRLEMGKMQFKKEPFDIVQLIRDVIREYMTTGSMKNIGLQLEEPSSIPQAVGDSDRVKQVLINLVGNALKFSEKGGITLRAEAKEEMVCVFIADTGKGIPLENQSLLFHKFQQAGSSLFTRDAVQGTGLGLYISKMMMEGMGGKIWLVSSEIGKGTTFGISLPMKTS